MQHSQNEVLESILQKQEADSLEVVPVVVHKVFVQLAVHSKGKQQPAHADYHQYKAKADYKDFGPLVAQREEEGVPVLCGTVEGELLNVAFEESYEEAAPKVKLPQQPRDGVIEEKAKGDPGDNEQREDDRCCDDKKVGTVDQKCFRALFRAIRRREAVRNVGSLVVDLPEE